jgi:hypothetical protein
MRLHSNYGVYHKHYHQNLWIFLTEYTGYTQKNGVVSKVNKKFISHLTRAQRTPLAAATVHVSHALPAVRFCNFIFSRSRPPNSTAGTHVRYAPECLRNCRLEAPWTFFFLSAPKIKFYKAPQQSVSREHQTKNKVLLSKHNILCVLVWGY